MGVEHALYNFLVLLEKWSDYPLHYDHENQKVVLKSKVAAKLRKGQPTIPRWYTILIALMFVYSIAHLSLLGSRIQGNEGGSNSFSELLEAVLYTFTVAGSGLTLVAWHTSQTGGTDLCVISNNLDEKFGGMGYSGMPSLERIPDAGEMAGYIGGFGMFGGLPPIIGLITLQLTYDPAEMLLHPLLNNPWRNIIASTVTTAVSFGVVIPTGLLITGCVWFTLRMTDLSRHNLEASRGMRCERRMENGKMDLPRSQGNLERYYDIVVDTLLRLATGKDNRTQKVGPVQSLHVSVLGELPSQKETTGTGSETGMPSRGKVTKVFRDRHHLHVQICILARIGNETFSLFIPYIQAFALVVCVVFNFGIIALLDRLDSQLLPFMFLVTVGATIINLILLNYASHLNVLTRETILFWGGVRLGPVERREVRSMRVASMSMGAFFEIKKETALAVIQTVLDNTINLVCM